MIKILGTDDSVNSCECCGKTGLKYTIVVEVDGVVMHYGSTCATRHTGMKSGQIKKAIEDKKQATIDAAKKEFHATIEYLNHVVKLAQLHRENIRPGKEFHAAQKEVADIADKKKKEICLKYSLEMSEFH